MTAEAVHREAVDLILSAIYPAGHQLFSSFMFGRPGAPHWERRLGTEIYCKEDDYIKAVLFIRQNGAVHLRSMAVNELRSLVTAFVCENYWYVRSVAFTRNKTASYAQQVTDEEKIDLATALASSSFFQPASDLTLYPLLTLNVEMGFQSRHFFFLDAKDLATARITSSAVLRDLDSEQFPPLKSWKYVKWPTASWLGIWAPSTHVSQKRASAVLGALALVLHPLDRYSFSQRKMQGGTCRIFDDRWSISPSDEPHTPGLMNNIVLAQRDGHWLEKLSALFDSADAKSVAKTSALEYFYRAWFLQPKERFSTLCMSLDALIGYSKKHTSTVVEYVKRNIETEVDDARLRLLMRIRGAVVHGAAPNVAESTHYATYYLSYNADPIGDLQLIVAKCLRQTIFGSSHKYHSYSNQLILDQMVERGQAAAESAHKRIISHHI